MLGDEFVDSSAVFDYHPKTLYLDSIAFCDRIARWIYRIMRKLIFIFPGARKTSQSGMLAKTIGAQP
jgi:hypothetical protein